MRTKLTELGPGAGVVAPASRAHRPGYAAGMSFPVTEVQKALKGADHPSDGERLAEVARGNGADSALVDAVRGMREVEGPDGVMTELKGQLGGEA